MKTYLEILVPFRYDEDWLEDLRDATERFPVRWQRGFYHITMAFLDETPLNVDFRPILKKHLAAATAPQLTFDRLDAFSTRPGRFVLYLTAMHVPEEFLSLTEAIRADLTAAGARIQSDFKLHVTLGRLEDPRVRLSALRKLMETVELDPITLTLTKVDYRVFRGKTIYEMVLRRA